jgi:transcription termination factor Rho
LASKNTTTDRSRRDLPFGAIAGEDTPSGAPQKKGSRKKAASTKQPPSEDGDAAAPTRPAPAESSARPAREGPTSSAPAGAEAREGGAPPGEGKRRRRRRRRGKGQGAGQGQQQQNQQQQNQHPPQQQGHAGQGKKRKRKPGGQDGGQKAPLPECGKGMFVLEKGGFGVLRLDESQYRPSKGDIYVAKRLIQSFKLSDGMLVTGPLARGQKHKFQLADVTEIDGKEPQEWGRTLDFKNLTSIDPDFHYATGDILDDVSMRIVDLLCPVGRGQRGLIVAPPRSGKTTLMRKFAAGIEKGYPDVHLMVLLIDERPEEATEWTRSVERGEVFVSTADETAKSHIQLAEAVWMRACRLVEMGEDVVLLLDSITRLARAYNNQAGAGGRTMSGGLDSRAMERPRKIFGSARNTVEAGSLTILGTTLVETGSRLDQLVFEEFKGTGNMELVLSRKLADRRIFPAIDVERSGTRKEEKLLGMRRLKQIHTLRRVLSRLHFAEAIETLITRLDDVEKTDDFLSRFTLDPEE